MTDALRVAPLASAGADWESLRRAIRTRPALPLRQSWRAEPEPLFAPGQVRFGLNGMALVVHASFRDRDVFNPVRHFNVPAFPHGDVFEVFVAPAGQESYFEFHLTPGGSLLQLRWPKPMRGLGVDWHGTNDPLLGYKIGKWRVRAQARESRQGWEAMMEIPLKRVFENDPPWHGSAMSMCFARYDYTRGRLRPVLSSTAALTGADFHRRDEWHRVELGFR